jgi:DNA-binding IclR family transcriptional regulator
VSTPRSNVGAQTLLRGLDVLQVVVDADRPMSVSQVAEAAQLDRSVTYRLLRTLESRRLVTQRSGQGFQAGLGLLRLMPRLRQTLAEEARPILADLARSTQATAVLSIRDLDEELCLLCVQPPGDGPFIGFREGAAGPLGRGASTLALLALHPAEPNERPEVTEARNAGPLAVVRTSGELRAATVGLAVAWRGDPDCSLAVVFFEGTTDESEACAQLVRAAKILAHV